MMTACPACNQRNPEDNRFCGMCGAKLERRRTPDSELLPEDSEHHSPAAEIPAVSVPKSPGQEPLHWHAAPDAPKASPKDPETIEKPLPTGDKPIAEEPRAAVPPRAPAVSEPTPTTSGSYMGFTLANEPAEKPRAEGDSGYAVSGPSFLGLSEQGGSSPEYLLEDDAPRHSAGKWFLGLVLLIGVLAYGQWRANGRGQTLFAGLPAIRAPKPVLANKQPATSANKSEDDDAPDMDVAPTNADLKAQTEVAKKADSDASKSQDADQKAAATASNDKSDPKTEVKAEPKADQQASTDTPSKGDGDKAAAKEDSKATEKADDEEPADASPSENVKAVAAKPDTARLEKTKAAVSKAKPKPPKQPDPSAAMLSQGQRYLYGQGVRKNCEQALNLIHGAANQGNAEARSQLGGMYATGNCAPFDRVTAYRWFTLALDASPRNGSVQRTRDMLWREMTDTERQRARNMAE